MNALSRLMVRMLQLAVILPWSSMAVATETAPKGLIATVRLYNPTPTAESSIVELPVGRLATPSLVDWKNVRLLHRGEFLPFALREGKAHWRAALNAPIKQPKAEDLLVFQICVPAGQWSEVQLVKGRDKTRTALRRRDGALVVAYPSLKVVIDERSGLLTELEACGESILGQPLRAEFYAVGEGVMSFEGGVGPGHNRSAVSIKKLGKLSPPKVELVSWSSAEALTEVNFLLRPDQGPAVALTYRIYPAHQIEIVSDERPWQGRSPWLDFGLEYELPLAGVAEPIAELQTHFPYYGFKDYPASVKSVGACHRGQKTVTFELGEESMNGRIWRRRLAIYPETDAAQRQERLQLLNQGLVVDVQPMCSAPLPAEVEIASAAQFHASSDLLVKSLRAAGLQAKAVPESAAKHAIALRLIGDPEHLGIAGDGFCIRFLPHKQGLEISAGTKFGLFKGALAFAQELNRRGDSVMAPLVAQNPVVNLRAGGFGGGNHEVDFPYGTPQEWEEVLGQLAGSGMNTMACLGMWSNWRMPVYFKYMPELFSDAAMEHDEVSGTPLSQTAHHREHALRLISFLHDRGVKVWLWIPVGAIPTTFQKRFPEAMLPGSTKVPRFMHPRYRQYLEAYFKELLEVYPVDGMVLIRDDNGGVDTTDEFKSFVAQSPTKSPVWEQHRVIYSLLRSQGFKGDITVYPYFDAYEPRLETLLPPDLLVIGHGSGMGTLTRHIETVGPMGDTWLDNLYAGFRLPTSGRMKRLLADRSSFWVGGAYCGTELPWEAVGYFGWEPTASVNTFRYDFGKRTFGKEKAIQYVQFSEASESLWAIMADRLLPGDWMTLTEAEKARTLQSGRCWLAAYRQRLDQLKTGLARKPLDRWFAHVGAYDACFDYYLRRAEIIGKMQDLIAANRAGGSPLAEKVRQQLISMHDEVYALARSFEAQATKVPGDMMASTRAAGLLAPFKENLAGYDRSLEFIPVLKVKQFDGALRVLPARLVPGQPFELQIELENRGCIPWMAGVGNDLVLQGDIRVLSLPNRWTYDGPPMVFGDRRVVTLRGQTPEKPGKAEIKVDFLASFRDWIVFSQSLELNWP